MGSNQLEESKKEFIAIASHKLLTPLSVIQFNAELLLKNTDISEETQEKLRDILKNTKQLVDFSGILLKTTDAYKGEGEQLISDIDISNVAETLKKEFESELVEINIDINLKDKVIKAPMQSTDLLSIVRFMVDNAIKYNKSERKKINITFSRDKGGLFTITILDNGIGVPDGEEEAIFSGFYRANNTKDIDVKGNGLSLYLSKKLLKNVAGDIALEKVDSGSKFVVKFPIK